MTIKQKDKLQTSKIWIIVSGVFVFVSTFLFFCDALTLKNKPSSYVKYPSMFDLIFGVGNENIKIGGLIILFIFQILLIVLFLIIIYDCINNEKISKGAFGLLIISFVLLLICIVLSFCTRAMYIDYNAIELRKSLESSGYYSTDTINKMVNELRKSLRDTYEIGVGPIMYGILELIAFFSMIGGIYCIKKNKY